MVGGLEASKGLVGCREPKGGRLRSEKMLCVAGGRGSDFRLRRTPVAPGRGQTRGQRAQKNGQRMVQESSKGQ